MMQARKNTQGFTLTEMIISIGIFGLMLGTALSALSQGMFVSTSSRLESEANAYLVNEMEYLQSLSWDDLVALPTKSSFSAQARSEDIRGSRLKQDRKSQQFEFKLTATWQNAQGKQQVASLVTFMSEDNR